MGGLLLYRQSNFLKTHTFSAHSHIQTRLVCCGAGFEKELNLTADQQTKRSGIRADFRSKAQALRNNAALSQEQKRTQMKELAKQHHEQMKSVLTNEQIEKLQSLKKERPAGKTK